MPVNRYRPDAPVAVRAPTLHCLLEGPATIHALRPPGADHRLPHPRPRPIPCPAMPGRRCPVAGHRPGRMRLPVWRAAAQRRLHTGFGSWVRHGSRPVLSRKENEHGHRILTPGTGDHGALYTRAIDIVHAIGRRTGVPESPKPARSQTELVAIPGVALLKCERTSAPRRSGHAVRGARWVAESAATRGSGTRLGSERPAGCPSGPVRQPRSYGPRSPVLVTSGSRAVSSRDPGTGRRTGRRRNTSTTHVRGGNRLPSASRLRSAASAKLSRTRAVAADTPDEATVGLTDREIAYEASGSAPRVPALRSHDHRITDGVSHGHPPSTLRLTSMTKSG
jgi:hypothetical protein